MMKIYSVLIVYCFISMKECRILTQSTDEYLKRSLELEKYGLTSVFYQYVRAEDEIFLSSKISERCWKKLKSHYQDDMKIFASSGQFPKDLQLENYIDFGNPIRCLGSYSKISTYPTRNRFKYCLIFIEPDFHRVNTSSERNFQNFYRIEFFAPLDMSIKIGLCAPSDCSSQEIQFLMNEALKPYFWVQQRPPFCKRQNFPLPTRLIQSNLPIKLSLFSLIFPIIFTLLAGAQDLVEFFGFKRKSNANYQQNWQYYFSPWRNLEYLLTPETGKRVFIFDSYRLFILVGGCLLHLLLWPWILISPSLVTGLQHLKQSTNKWTYQWMLNGIVLEVVPLFGVNTSAFSLWKKLDNQKSWKIVLKLTLDRFFQFIPILIALVALTIVLPLLHNDDPISSFYTERVSRNCVKNFWLHFFHLTNFIDPEAMCTLHTWTFSIDLQFIFLNGIIIWFHQRKPKLGFILNASLALVGLIHCICQVFLDEIPPNFLLWPFLARDLYRNWKSLYISFFSHLWSIMLGTLGVKLIMNRTDKNIPKVIKRILYTVGCCCLIVLVNSIGVFNVLRVEQTKEINSIFLFLNIILFMVFWSAVLLFVSEDSRKVFMLSTDSNLERSIILASEGGKCYENAGETPKYHKIVLILLKIWRQIYYIHGVVYIWYFAKIEKPIDMSSMQQHLKFLSFATLPSALLFYLCISGPYERFYSQVKKKLFYQGKKE